MLQGIVLGFLVTSFVKTVDFRNPNWLRNGFELHHAYLPYVASLILIAFIWNEYALGIFYLHWPISAMQTLLSFVAAALEIFVVSVPDDIGLWSTSLGFMFVVAFLIRRRNQYIVSPDLYRTPEERVKNVPVKDLKFYAAAVYGSRHGDPLIQFIVAILLFLPIGLVYTFNPALVDWSIPVLQTRINILDFVLPSIAILLFTANLVIDDHFFLYYTEGILKTYNSPYTVTRHGRIGVRQIEEQP